MPCLSGSRQLVSMYRSRRGRTRRGASICRLHGLHQLSLRSSNNRIREGVTIHRGTQPESATTVGSGCFIMANTHVAHNCHGVIFANNVALAGHVDIGNKPSFQGESWSTSFVASAGLH